MPEILERSFYLILDDKLLRFLRKTFTSMHLRNCFQHEGRVPNDTKILFVGFLAASNFKSIKASLETRLCLPSCFRLMQYKKGFLINTHFSDPDPHSSSSFFESIHRITESVAS